MTLCPPVEDGNRPWRGGPINRTKLCHRAPSERSLCCLAVEEAEKAVPTLRVLLVDGAIERLRELAEVVVSVGHVVLLEADLENVGPITLAERPDLAIVVVGESSAHALTMIDKIVHEAACPVIAVLDVEDPAFIKEAAKRGIFAYITGIDDTRELESSIDIVLRRFAEYHDLEGAFGRRAVTERAKGILMERHSIDERTAFNMLRAESRRTNRKLIEVADAVVMSRPLLPGGGARDRAAEQEKTVEEPS